MLRLSALYRYPLKSGKAEVLQQIGLDKLGLDGDRRWMLVDEASGRFLTQRAVAKMSQLSALWNSTGSLFADWIDVYAQRSDTGADVIAATRARQPGVVHSDDWDGFGQRTTGSGTSRFTDAVVEADNVIDFSTRFKYQTAFYQLVLLASLAGIGRAALRDVAHQVRSRKRIYSHGNAAHVSQDSQILQVVGEVAALVYAAEASALKATLPAQRAYVARFGGDEGVEREANVAAEIESATAQVVVSELIQRATSELFNALGASDVRQGKALDRHWRNARTVSSHNPVIYKARIVGDWVVNGVEPPFVWQIGNGSGKV